jgi:hypothetical protein
VNYVPSTNCCCITGKPLLYTYTTIGNVIVGGDIHIFATLYCPYRGWSPKSLLSKYIQLFLHGEDAQERRWKTYPHTNATPPIIFTEPLTINMPKDIQRPKTMRPVTFLEPLTTDVPKRFKKAPRTIDSGGAKRIAKAQSDDKKAEAK